MRPQGHAAARDQDRQGVPAQHRTGVRGALQDGQLKTLHFSISEIPDNTGYTPRKADDRVGYFTTAFDDLGKFKKDETAHALHQSLAPGKGRSRPSR